MNILFATSEAYPLLKTGGLGDVANSLPNSLQEHGADVRLVIPAYRDVLEKLDSFEILGWLKISAQHHEIRVLQVIHDAFAMPVWLVDYPEMFDRIGNPYTHPEGYDWPDNPQRFDLFSHVAALLAIDALNIGWKADVVHANDWQTGLVHAYLSRETHPPKRVFTIHNIAYDCQFDYGTFQSMHLPPHWWSMELGEFYDRFSMLKTGLIFSDVINTVSPNYADEICTPQYGYGYASILSAHRDKLHGIINGIDMRIWSPGIDTHLAKNYTASDKIADIKKAKKANKKALLKMLGADKTVLNSPIPLIGFVGRLVFQKGIDLLLNAIEQLLPEYQAHFVIIGSGEPELESQLRLLTGQYPQQLFSHIGYSEALAHLVEAGSDMFIMPSRYEPCGLNQLYSLHYGTPAIVRRTGGLTDTVTDANPVNFSNNTATGILFDDMTPEAVGDALQRATGLFSDQKSWSQLMINGMAQDFSWEKSARAYLQLYNN